MKLFKDKTPSEVIITAAAIIFLASVFIAVGTESYFLVGIPVFLLIVFVAIVDFKKLFFLLLFSLPFSIETSLPGGIGTDLPSEPLMVGMLVIMIFFTLQRAPSMGGRFLVHPISLLLLMHYCWVVTTTLTTSEEVVSIKYLLAKTWYIGVFYFMAGYLLKREIDLKNFVAVIMIPLTITMMIVLGRHAAEGFSFKEVHFVMGPFYRNHVIYAALIAVFLPFLWYAKRWFKGFNIYLWGGLILFSLIAIQFAYTRAAYIGLFLAVVSYFVFKMRLMKWVLGISSAIALAIIIFLAAQNRFLDYAPNYEKTITHTRFDNLVEATYKMEDISTMERVYRWVAGAYMVADKPVFGFGPGNFYFFYETYTVNRFQTYVSNNEDKSGIHNYFLMVAVEQGIPGAVIFLILCFTVLIYGENVYHRLEPGWQRDMLMAALLSTIVIDALLLVNDLVETDKVGSLFFINMALIVNLGRVREEKGG